MTPASISWPAAFLLAVLTVCFTTLVWKGAIPSHALFAIGGAIVGWVVPRAAGEVELLRLRRADRKEAEAGAESVGGFSKEEIPTKPEQTTAAGTVIMQAVKRKDVEKK